MNLNRLILVVIQLIIVKGSNRIALTHNRDLKLSAVNSQPNDSCTLTTLKRNEHCFAIGCKSSNECPNEGTDHKLRCCPVSLDQIQTTCCKSEDNTTVRRINIQSLERFTEQCPPVRTIIQPGYHCLEYACQTNGRCLSPGLGTTRCCQYLWLNQTVHCCLAKALEKDGPPRDKRRAHSSHVSMANVRPQRQGHSHDNVRCPPSRIPRFYHCMEVGCTLHKSCRTRGLQHQWCCLHEWSGIAIPCCLMKSPMLKTARYNYPKTDETCEEDSLTITEDEYECPPYEVKTTNTAYECLEAGCELGVPCASPDMMKGAKCCEFIFEDSVLNCCLQVALETDDGSSVVQASTIPMPQQQCPPYHIYLHEPCKKCREAKDCFSEVCCRYVQWWGEVLCCGI